MEKSKGSAGASEEALDAYLDRIKHLPPKPTLMIELIKLFRQPNADVEQIVALLRHDPVLSIEVLRRCNSSYGGLEEPVMDIYEAVFRLGFYEVYQITVTLFGMRMMSMKKELHGFPIENLRLHSTMTAVAAGALALEAGESEGLAFTAGLLHDVGKMVLALAENEKYAALLEDCRRDGSSLNEAEKKLFGFNHTEIGARLLHRWGVPVEVVLPVLEHHEPQPMGEWRRFAMITNISSRLANYIQEQSPSLPFSQTPGVDSLMESLELSHGQIHTWERFVRDKVKQLPALLNG
jgi:putative nucleotidyltransferase with HDIG domain